MEVIWQQLIVLHLRIFLDQLALLVLLLMDNLLYVLRVLPTLDELGRWFFGSRWWCLRGRDPHYLLLLLFRSLVRNNHAITLSKSRYSFAVRSRKDHVAFGMGMVRYKLFGLSAGFALTRFIRHYLLVSFQRFRLRLDDTVFPPFLAELRSFALLILLFDLAVVQARFTIFFNIFM